MKSGLTGDDVVRDIEFELAQGALSRNELGQSIQAVQQYQNKLRSEVFQSSGQASADREALSRLFQVNDMLIAMLKEMVATLESLRRDLRRVASQASQVATTSAAAVGAPVAERGVDVDMPVAMDGPVVAGNDEMSHWRPPIDVEEAMRPDALRVEPEVRLEGLPIVGGLLRRLRITLHNLVLFYVAKLARKQSSINQTYGDWILHLGQLNQHQQQEIDLLSAQVSALQSRLGGEK